MSVRMREAIRLARDSGRLDKLVAAIPYAQFMGITMAVDSGDVLGKLAYAEHLIGNAALPALHGGSLGALLESTAIFKLLWDAESVTVPKTINITVEYLRSGKAQDTFARAELTKHGRRIANVRAFAWQDDPTKPVAAANAHFLLTSQSGSE